MGVRLRVFIGLTLSSLVALTAALHALVQLPPRGQTPTERCTECHAGLVGIEPAHELLGCARCHLGEPNAGQLPAAHVGLVRIPGNFSDMAHTCGAAGCHVDVPARLLGNVMSTMNGVVSVDRWVFGEQPTPTAVSPVAKLGTSPADLHLRNLCASCHLGHEKRDFGPIDELTRGGGCNACHLASAGDLDGGPRHATLRALPHELACFGCHARSGRISLSYEGWHELTELDGGCAPPARRALADGRCVERRPADVHAEAGLRCVDCHGSWEVMGDGRSALHREDQSVVRCDDCHTATPRTAGLDALDPESRRLLRHGTDRTRWVTLAKSGRPLVNTWVDDAGTWLESKYTRRVSRVKPPAQACTRAAHRSVACASCHSAWAPQCPQCHTSYDAAGGMYDLLDDAPRAGEWLEEGGVALAEPPSLGVREGDAGREIIPFAPGMVLTLGDDLHRLFAPISPHTTRATSRSCSSCHADPLALGYGRGQLRFEGGTWQFEAAAQSQADGLPADAWLGFLSAPRPGSTTRENTRAFTVEEQRRVLTVGACLSCHAPDSTVMGAALDDFGRALRGRSTQCVLPLW